MSVPTVSQSIPNGRPGRNPSARARLQREYVSGGRASWSPTGMQALSWAIDDIAGDLGDDIYERMLVDPQIAACITTLKAGILDEEVELGNPIEDEDAPEFVTAAAIVAFCERVLAELQLPLQDILWDMLDAIPLGCRVAEQTYRLAEDWPRLPDGAVPLVLDRLTVKPRRATAFVVDTTMRVVGLIGAPPGRERPEHVGMVQPENVLPRAKFAVLTFRPRNNDPRGTSILRPAYNPWWLKVQVWPEYLKYLTQFAGPSMWATTPEGAEAAPEYDVNGVEVAGSEVTPEQALLRTLQDFRNGTAAAFPAGTELHPIHPPTGTSPFIEAISLFNREIVHSILHQELATMEGEHMARAAAQTHQDLLTVLVRELKDMVERMIVRDILRPLVAYNFGPEAGALVPTVSLGRVEQQDMTRFMGAVATLFGAGYFTPSQLTALDRLLGFPVRQADEQSMADARTAEAASRAEEQEP